MPRISTDNYDTVASWNGSQDLFIVEQPDGTKVATPAMVKQYILNDMDEVPTQDSNNPVKSGGIFSTMAVPKYDATNRREYFEGGAAFDGNIDSSPTAGSNNAVASGGTKTYVDNAVAGAKSYADSAVAAIHPDGNTVSAPFLESHSTVDIPIKLFETGNEDYKAIAVYDKNNVERYMLRFTGGHLSFTSKNASGTTIVSGQII